MSKANKLTDELRAKLGIKPYKEASDEYSREYLTRVLTATGGDRMTAAAVSGLNRTHLQALIKRHHVQVKPNLKNRGRRRAKATDEVGETETADG